MGSASQGYPVRFRTKIDGATPLEPITGPTCMSMGRVVQEPRMYQLIGQTGSVVDRTFEIEFLDAGVHADVFTFG